MMEKSRWDQYKEKNGATVFDMFKPSTQWTDEFTSSSRMSICSVCPELISLTKQCKKCGCFMAAKTKLQNARCPMNKW